MTDATGPYDSGVGAAGVIGVLDLQGGVVEHVTHLRRLGIASRRVKLPGDLSGLAGLILPGGESTCIAKLLKASGLDRAILSAAADGLVLWGTCAGAILLAARIEGEAAHLGLVDMTVRRNAFGSQLDSFVLQVQVAGVAADEIPLVFIRAPKILSVGPGVRVLLRRDDTIAAAETDGALVTVFHPELSPSTAFHAYFARKCGLSVGDGAGAANDEDLLREAFRQQALVTIGPGGQSSRAAARAPR